VNGDSVYDICINKLSIICPILPLLWPIIVFREHPCPLLCVSWVGGTVTTDDSENVFVLSIV